MIQTAERKKMLTVPLVGEVLVGQLESIGISGVNDLRGKDPLALIKSINDKAGHNIARGPFVVEALQNLIATAEKTGP